MSKKRFECEYDLHKVFWTVGHQNFGYFSVMEYLNSSTVSKKKLEKILL